MATAKKLPSGNWRVQAKVTINGKSIVKSFTDSDKKTAEYKATVWQHEKKSDEVERMTVGVAIDRYIESKMNILSPATTRAYLAMRRNVFQDLMGIFVEDLTHQRVQTAINQLSTGHSPKYVRNAHGLLSATLRMFRPDFILTTTMPQKIKSEMYIPDDKDIKHLMKIVEGTDMEIPILLAAFGPMRRGEICALTSDDVSGNIITVNKALAKSVNNQWIVKSPKTYASYRKIEYPDFVIEKISGIKGKITQLTPNAITDAFPKILDKAGLPHFRFHDLRHYTVSILHAIGVPDKYIMARGGWNTNYTMNNVYNHALKQQRDLQTKKILQYFSDINN